MCIRDRLQDAAGILPPGEQKLLTIGEFNPGDRLGARWDTVADTVVLAEIAPEGKLDNAITSSRIGKEWFIGAQLVGVNGHPIKTFSDKEKQLELIQQGEKTLQLAFVSESFRIAEIKHGRAVLQDLEGRH